MNTRVASIFCGTFVRERLAAILKTKEDIHVIEEAQDGIETVEKASPVLSGKFARYIITGEEWEPNKFKLGFASYVGKNKETKVKDEYKTLKVERANGTYFTFDANNKYDLKKLEPSNVTPTGSDLPF
jgi:TPP-dependent indolepyruvate ferredoxin oxidoreductase alpha subunit